jgi:tetratricopeptide (TPR) repeat protein
MEDLRKRVENGLPLLREVDGALPEALESIVTACTQTDPLARYQTTQEVCAALDRLDDQGQVLPEPRRITWRVVAAAVVLVAGLTSGIAWLLRPAPPPVEHEPVSVLIADFENLTGDPEFSGAVEQALGVGLEKASFVSVFPRTDARALLAQIAPESGGRISSENGQLVAMREAIKVLVSGTINPIARGYRIGVRLRDPTDGKIVASAERSVTGKSDVLKAVGELARDARAALGESKAEIEKAETYTASSLRAVQEYTIAQDFQADYKDQDAIEHYRRASTEDPNFGRAYAGWAYSALKLGRQDEAADAWKKALSLIERMTEREKYRTLGVYYGTMTRDFEKAIENYATLVRLYPADDAGHNNLALAYFSVRNFTKALEEGRLTVRLYPRMTLYRNNVALYAMYASDFATAVAEAARVAQDKPDFYPAYLPLAIAALGEGKLDNARGFYAQMAKTGAAGASVAATGLADIALYVGRDAEAARILEEAIAEDVKTDNQTAMAAKHVVLAEAHLGTGRKAAAVRAARKALEISRSEEIAFPAARILSAAGLAQEADALARELGAQLEPQRRAYGKLIEADVARSRRQTVEALEAIRSAQKLTDLWLGRFMLGRLYVEAGRHAEAVSELDLAQKRRGEATAVFLDDIPSYRYLAALPYWLGRAQEGLGLTPAARASYQAFIGARSSAGKDPLVADARRRIEKL